MYFVIQSCFDYQTYLSHILEQLDSIGIQDNIIIVYNKAPNNSIQQNKYTQIFTTDNLYELSSFKQLAIHYNLFKQFDKFLFVHDTVSLGEQFENKLKIVNSLLDNRPFDWAPLAYNFQCMMGIAHIDFIKKEWTKFLSLPSSITKQEAIDVEWCTGTYENYCMRNLCDIPYLIGRNPKVKRSKINWLGLEERTEIYFESLDLYKYYKHPKIRL